MALAYYNKLPTRPEYVARLLEVLKGGESYQLMQAIRLSRLTRTQVLCALDELIAKGDVEIIRGGGTVRYLRR